MDFFEFFVDRVKVSFGVAALVPARFRCLSFGLIFIALGHKLVRLWSKRGANAIFGNVSAPTGRHCLTIGKARVRKFPTSLRRSRDPVQTITLKLDA